MNVTREVIVDLLPVYLSGEASPDTKALVEEFLKQDVELSQRIRNQWIENMAKATPAVLPPELELRILRRTKSLLSRQKWLLAFAILFTFLPLSFEFSTRGFHGTEFHFLFWDHPGELSVCIALGVAFWIGYVLNGRRLRTTSL